MSMEYLWTPWRMQYISGAQAGSANPTPNAGEEPAAPRGAQSEADPPATPAATRAEKQGSGAEEGCVFCDRLSMPSERDRENLLLYRGKRSFIILNLYPYNSAHLMIVPNKHTADFVNLDPETVGEMMALSQTMLRVIGEEYRPEGFNLGMNLGRVAGAGVADHLHVHIVPRWAGDTNFMPVVGSTKVMPELLETTYDRLKARLDLNGGNPPAAPGSNR